MAFFAIVTRLAETFYRHPAPRFFFATFFSIGKVLSSAGSTLFGVKETLNTYGLEGSANASLSYGLTILNAFVTTSNRVPSIYTKLLGKTPEDTPPTEGTPPYHALPESEEQPISIYPGIKILYVLMFGLCLLSTPFSALNAYLSSITLAREMNLETGGNASIALASFVTSSSMASYFSFNLMRMGKNVQRCCDALNRRLHGEAFGFATKTVIVTLLSTVFGTMAGIGTSYLGTSKSLELFPLTHNFPTDVKEALVLTSVIASLSSSTFLFGVSSYDLIDNFINQFMNWQQQQQHRANSHTSTETETESSIPYYAKLMILIDSISSSFTGFIGVNRLVRTQVNVEANNLWLILFGCLPPSVNNIIMNYAIGLVGCKPTTDWLRQQKQRLTEWCRPQPEPVLLTTEPRSHGPELNVEDLTHDGNMPCESTPSGIRSFSLPGLPQAHSPTILDIRQDLDPLLNNATMESFS